MKNIEIQDLERLEFLLKNKKFDTLTPDERQWVLSFMTESDYLSMSGFYSDMDKETPPEAITPSVSVKTKLDASFASAAKRSTPVFRRRIPFYQSAAAALLFFLMGYWVSLMAAKSGGNDNMVQNVVRDTIQVIQYVKDTAVALPANAIHFRTISRLANANAKSVKHIIRQEDVESAHESKSLSEDSILKKMLVVLR